MSPAVDAYAVPSVPPLRHGCREGERMVVVEFTETHLPYQYGERAGFPEEEGHRVAAWLGHARAVDFVADVARGLEEHRRRLRG